LKIDLSDEATLLFTGILNALNASVELTEKTNELLAHIQLTLDNHSELMQKTYDMTEDYIDKLNVMLGVGKK